ncbi:MAG: DPP IV N-terminal domain-containing protein [Myxococcota bacterium]
MNESESLEVAVAAASASPITFARIAAFPPPGWQVPRAAQLSPDGSQVTYLQAEGGGEEMALFAFDLATREHRVLVRAADLVETGRALSREEELRRERQRKRITGVTSYAWARDAEVMLLPLGGDVFVRKADGAIVRLTDSEPPEIDPKICADGRYVAFARGPELYVVDVATQRERALTSGAAPGVTRGQSDFNGQEEFGEPSGFWWAPSCDRLAYLEVDETAVGRIPVMGYRDTADLQMLRYPRAGTVNPQVTLHVVDIATQASRPVSFPEDEAFAEGHYLGRVRFADDGRTLYVQRLDRTQQHLALVRVDVATGRGTHIIEEESSSWIEFADYRLVGDDLLWTGPREGGHRHLERRDPISGDVRVVLTRGRWDVFRLLGLDATKTQVLFMGNRDAVLDRQIYSVPRAGGGAEPKRISTVDGVHEVATDAPARGYVDIHSSLTEPPRAVVVDAQGQAAGSLPVPRDDDFGALKLRTPELVTIEDENRPPLYGAMLKPRDMVPGRRYPVIVMVYGGPGVQTIKNEWNPRLLWQHLADRGFVIWQLDNRGSTGRGHDFEAPLYRHMGHVELEDQLRGVAHLTGLPFVDPSRIGIYGHSYGGYMATLAMLEAPDVFKVGVGGSPVTDWRFYDTGYTERFMATPQNNRVGYEASSVLPRVAKLRGKLLIIHALMDENVHFEHTAKLIDAFVAADKDFDLLVFPGERHGYRTPAARRYAYRRVADYFASHL